MLVEMNQSAFRSSKMNCKSLGLYSTLAPSALAEYRRQSEGRACLATPILTRVKSIFPVSIDTNQYVTKTARHLETVFGNLPIIKQYDESRVSFKKYPNGNRDRFKDISAQLDIMVKNEKMKLENDRKKIEEETLVKNNYDDVNVTDSHYKDIIRKLKILKAIYNIFR